MPLRTIWKRPRDTRTHRNHLPAKGGETVEGRKFQAREGLVTEGGELMEKDMTEALTDAALIAAAQRVERQEIAGYGCVLHPRDEFWETGKQPSFSVRHSLQKGSR